MIDSVSMRSTQLLQGESYGQLKAVKYEDAPLFTKGVQKEANIRLKSIAELATQKESEGKTLPVTVMTAGGVACAGAIGAKIAGVSALAGPVGWVIGGGAALVIIGGALLWNKKNNTDIAANTANRADINLGNNTKSYKGNVGLMSEDKLKEYATLSGYDKPLHVIQVAFNKEGDDSKIQISHSEIDSTKFRGDTSVVKNELTGISSDVPKQISRNYKEFIELYTVGIRGNFQSDEERQRFLDIAKALTTDTEYMGQDEDSTFFDINQDGFINDGDLNFITLLQNKALRKEYLNSLLTGGNNLNEKMLTWFGRNLDIDGSGQSHQTSPIADEKDRQVLLNLMDKLNVKTIDELLEKYDNELGSKIDVNANGTFDEYDIALVKTYLNGLANVKYRADKISAAVEKAVGTHAIKNFIAQHPKTKENE